MMAPTDTPAPAGLATIEARVAELVTELRAALMAGSDSARIRAALDGLQAQAAAARAELAAEAQRHQAHELAQVDAAASNLAKLSAQRLRKQLARFAIPTPPAVAR